MANQPRCGRCGRILRDPVSVAIGMGPTCRGANGGGKGHKVGQRTNRGRLYVAGSGQASTPLPSGDLSNIFKREQPAEKNPFERWLEGASVSAETARAGS